MIFIRSVEHPSPLYGYASNHSSWRNSTLHACTLSRFYSSAATSIVLRSIETRKTTAHAGVAARYYCLVADVWRTRCAATATARTNDDDALSTPGSLSMRAKTEKSMLLKVASARSGAVGSAASRSAKACRKLGRWRTPLSG